MQVRIIRLFFFKNNPSCFMKELIESFSEFNLDSIKELEKIQTGLFKLKIDTKK